MPKTVPCSSCGNAIPFEEWQRGEEVYCPSCGRPGRVPIGPPAPRLAPAPPPSVKPAPPEPTIFAADAFSQAPADRYLSQVICPKCKAPIPVRAVDADRDTIACRLCGAEAPIRPETPSAPAPESRHEPADETEPARIGGGKPLRVGWLPLAAIVSVAAVTLFGSIVRSPGARATDRPAATRPVRPDAVITSESISALDQYRFPIEAVHQANQWRKVLDDIQAPADDPRRRLLDESLARLTPRAVPEAPPDSPAALDFIEQAKAIEAALPLMAGGDATARGAARAAVAKVDSLIAQHRAELEPRAGPYQTFRAMYQNVEAQLIQAEPVDKLLSKAREQAENGRPTEALEGLARARLMGLTAGLSRSQRQALQRRYREVADGPVRVALCTRDLDDAGRRPLRDTAARAWLVVDARAQYDQVRAPAVKPPQLLERIQTLESATRQPPEGVTPPEDLLARQQYEEALTRFGTWPHDDPASWIEGCLDLQELNKRLAGSQPVWSSTLAELVRQGLGGLVTTWGTTHREDSRTPGFLIDLRALMGQLEPWNSRPEWSDLERELKNRSAEVGHHSLELAEAFLKQGLPGWALATAEQAARLCDDPEAKQARALIARCLPALARQTRRE